MVLSLREFDNYGEADGKCLGHYLIVSLLHFAICYRINRKVEGRCSYFLDGISASATDRSGIPVMTSLKAAFWRRLCPNGQRPRTNIAAFWLGKRDTAEGRASMKRKACIK